jgi:glycosyltransferase involved in cell wall biosynthesis
LNDAKDRASTLTDPVRATSLRIRLSLTIPPATSFSLIIPVFNGGEAFSHCLRSVRELEPAVAEWIVVDDGSTDDSADRAREAGARVISTARPRSGPAVARNLGAKAASGEWVFFLDADCSLHRDALGVARRTIESHPVVAALVGSYDTEPTAPNLLSQYKNLAHHLVHQGAPSEGFTMWGACGAIRRDVFLRLGGFDERYGRPCIEDIELGYRLKEAGHRIRMCPDLQVTHHKVWRPLGLLRTEVCDRAIPWSELILGRGQMENALNIDRRARLRVALSGLLTGLALLGCWWWPAWCILGVGAALLLALDWPLLSQLAGLRGGWFAIRVSPWHWFSHFYSGVSFALVLWRRNWQKLGQVARVTMAPPVPTTESETTR